LIVVSDTSPILNLARIGRLDLLASLYTEVLVPAAVRRELSDFRRDRPAAVEVPPARWLIVAPLRVPERMAELRQGLDPGEAEAIALALERQADLLLLDERRARRIASALGLRISGLLGVLAEAKRAGLIERAEPVLDDLIQRARFWIAPDLYARVLRELGER
jgi:uncharacterized protein